MSDEIFNQVAKIIAQRIHIPSEQINIDSNFEELGIDSLGAVSLIYDLEDEFNIQISNETAMQIHTVRQIVESIQELGVK